MDLPKTPPPAIKLVGSWLLVDNDSRIIQVSPKASREYGLTPGFRVTARTREHRIAENALAVLGEDVIGTEAPCIRCGLFSERHDGGVCRGVPASREG